MARTDVTSENTDTNNIDVKELLNVLLSIKKGNFSVRMPIDKTGTAGKVADTLNEIIEANSNFADELEKAVKIVGGKGNTAYRISNKNFIVKWSYCIDLINDLVNDLVWPTNEMARVISAVAEGDLNQTVETNLEGRKITGEFLKTANIINTMVEKLGVFASEVTRIAYEVGTEGKLGGQANVKGAGGTWKDLTNSVNLMVNNLTEQMRNISEVASGVAKGDLSKKITVDARGEILRLKDTINGMVDQLEVFASEVTRVAYEVGTEGKLGGQAQVKGVGGTWKDLTNSVNLMVNNLTEQMRNISEVASGVAKGDLSKKITVDARGEILRLKDTINGMVDQLEVFASEVTRVAYEVGTEGKLGGQARVEGVSGIWRDLTDRVNLMAANLTKQVRSKVVTAMSKGDLRQKLRVDAEGEIAELADTINNTTDTLEMFASEVTTVAREVGIEGKLGGQANVPSANGTWKSLVDNVNGLAQNLTTQVRAITSVATAVAKGDLSHNVTAEAVGEVAVLKDNVNEMIANLKETTKKNTEQDWLNTNLAKFNRMLQGQRDISEVCKIVLAELAPLVQMQHGVFYISETNDEGQILKMYGSYGFQERKHISDHFKPGEGLLGQCLVEKQRILLTDVPADYVKINSALGEATPLNIVVLPIIFEGDVLAVLELASFHFFNDLYLNFLDQLSESLGIVINTIHVNMRTEDLLKQSQSLTEELQQQQEELTQTNEELEEKAKLLVDQNSEVEQKNKEVEQARLALEERAEQLAVTSKYKSEFLANMSHELRTPLNSLLVLAQQLKENVDGNLTEKQLEFASIIFDSGNELLALINDILDLSKIESGTVTPVFSDISISEIKDNMERTFGHIAQGKTLGFEISVDPSVPVSINSDEKRLLQVLKNLLSNAFKFTSEGKVTLKISTVTKGWPIACSDLDNAETVLAFEVADTGIGIAPDKQKIIFEAFQQADGSTSRKYGGTGLGLAISREIAHILGGEIRLYSVLGKGSTFTLYIPASQDYHVGKSDLSRVHDDKKNGEANGSFARNSEVESHKYYVHDNRDEISGDDNVILTIEDDAKFAGILSKMAQERGFKSVVTLKGSNAMDLIRKYMPVAIILDLRLPDTDGWGILERIKSDMSIRHIPVHIISADNERIRGLQKGALTYLNKPVSNEDLEGTFDNIKMHLNVDVQNLLVVSKNSEWDVDRLLEGINVKVISKNSGEEAIAELGKQSIDCIILDSQLSDMSAVQFVAEMQKDPLISEIPVIVYAKDKISKEEEVQLNKLAENSVLKEVKSSERLLDEVTLFLHKVIDNLPDTKRNMIKEIYHSDDVLQNKKILIVDDDMRNIFALSSALERYGVVILSAENGKEAIDTLKKDPSINIVLMDIMMPEMNGYETIQAIRRIHEFKSLPIIALTAKAMKGDRGKCIEAGASDYITKPVDVVQLLSLLRVWLYR